uniref:Uncharacterized protein n=1 Tax=Pseudictyota dubia TaxID=2749911 RepID=A0A7R9VXF1_9STRA|mmetsp:Transcript_25388/g.47262  ORF Transcript_25388/g.47262 Transcript_25388/m.47262 type:complete len:135 (+) Transcript_25388:60-464(+)
MFSSPSVSASMTPQLVSAPSSSRRLSILSEAIPELHHSTLSCASLDVRRFPLLHDSHLLHVLVVALRTAPSSDTPRKTGTATAAVATALRDSRRQICSDAKSKSFVPFVAFHDLASRVSLKKPNVFELALLSSS